MAQFDVHQNSGGSRQAVPFLVVLQSHRYRAHALRLVAPLVVPGPRAPYPELVPRFVIEGLHVALDPLMLQSVPSSALGPAIASLADDDSAGRIITAIDSVISRAQG